MDINNHGAAEIFGFKASSESQEAINSRERYYCPFLDGRCQKKSEYRGLEQNIPFGVCSVWKRGKKSIPVPHIICPIRFEQNNTIFKDAANFLIRNKDDEVIIIPEVSITEFGRIDYIVTQRDKHKKIIEDFLLLEVMAVSTTGTGQIIQSMLDKLKHTKVATNKYGINFRQVISRLIVQGIVKAEACQSWKKSMIWAIQDVLFDYMLKTTKLDLSPIQISSEVKSGDFPVYFYVYTLFENGETNSYDLTLSSIYGGTIITMMQMLNGQNIPKLETIEKAIAAKLEKTELTALRFS